MMTMTTTATPTDNDSRATMPLMTPLFWRILDDLHQRGIRALPSSREGEFLFSRDASTTAPIVAMAVRVFEATSGHSFGAQSGFTRGGFCLSDNFDSVRGRVRAVENFAFGGARTYLEYFEAHAFMSDHVRCPAARVLASLPKFAQILDRMGLEDALGVHPEYRALRDTPDSSSARLCFFDALARRHLETVHRAVLKLGPAKGIGLEDPVFAAAAAAEENLRALAAEDNATLVHYFDVRLALLDHVSHANLRFAKLAFGRGAMWPLIEEA
jgi:hypothetical protein